MADPTFGKKRKSKPVENEGTATKKVKSDKSGAKPAPLKSALKKPAKDGKLAGKGVPVAEKAQEKGKKTGTLKSKDAEKPAEKSRNEKSKAKSAKNPQVKSITSTEADHVTLDLPSDQEEGGTTLTADQTAALLAGFSDSEDEDASDKDGIPSSKIPLAPTTGLVQKRIAQAIAEQSNPETTPGVLYIGRLPHGFYEHQLRAYLSQFGEILHLRLARNRKTGKSQHYAFVEFASAAVAEIVAKTMDKYLLFGHLLQVRKVPREQVKENMFAGSEGRRGRRPIPRNKIEGGRLRRGMVREEWEKRVEKEDERRREKAEKLKELGYDFEMPEVKKVSEVPVKAKVIEEGDAEGVTDAVETLPAVDGENSNAVAVVESDDVIEEVTKKSKKRTSSDAQAKKTKKAKKIKA